MTLIEWMEAVAPLLNAIAWPAVVAFVALRFRENVAGLIDRMVKAGPAEFEPPHPVQQDLPEALPAPAVAGEVSAEGLDELRTEAIIAMEDRLRALPLLANAPNAETRTSTLVTIAAAAAQQIQFLSIERLIWRSQITILEILRSRPAGAKADLLLPIYEQAATRSPAQYLVYPFESYLSFLVNGALAEKADGHWSITANGTDYLDWRVRQGNPPPLME